MDSKDEKVDNSIHRRNEDEIVDDELQPPWRAHELKQVVRANAVLIGQQAQRSHAPVSAADNQQNEGCHVERKPRQIVNFVFVFTFSVGNYF